MQLECHLTTFKLRRGTFQATPKRPAEPPEPRNGTPQKATLIDKASHAEMNLKWSVPNKWTRRAMDLLVVIPVHLYKIFVQSAILKISKNKLLFMSQ
jgi:hypothetical protein